jgi:hypothetical protein
MTYVLLFVALNQAPAYLGTYPSEVSCQQAIRANFEKSLPPQIRQDPKMQQVIDLQLKYQLEYRCVPQ